MSSTIKFNEAMLKNLAGFKLADSIAADMKKTASEEVQKAKLAYAIEDENQKKGLVPENAAKLEALHNAITTAVNKQKVIREGANSLVTKAASFIPEILYPAYCEGIAVGYNVFVSEHKDKKGNVTTLEKSFNGYLVEWLLGGHLATGVNEKSMKKFASKMERFFGGKVNFDKVEALGQAAFQKRFSCMLIDYVRTATGSDIVVTSEGGKWEAHWENSKEASDSAPKKSEEKTAA